MAVTVLPFLHAHVPAVTSLIMQIRNIEKGHKKISKGPICDSLVEIGRVV